MSRPNPKFSIGEPVVVTKESPSSAYLVGVVVDRIFDHENIGLLIPGWSYELTTRLDYMFAEKILRPRPPEQKGEWDNCAWRPRPKTKQRPALVEQA